jgi:hypothetical protein
MMAPWLVVVVVCDAAVLWIGAFVNHALMHDEELPTHHCRIIDLTPSPLPLCAKPPNTNTSTMGARAEHRR